MPTQVANLTKTIIAEAGLSVVANTLLKGNDMAATFDAAVGMPTDLFPCTESMLVLMGIDDSSSIRFVQGNTEAVRDGYNLVLDALKESKADESILITTSCFNTGVLMPFSLLPDAVRMTPQNYNPRGGTPLFDFTFDLLHTALAKTAEYEAASIPVRTITVIITDGADCGSTRHTAADVAVLVRDMCLKSEKHIVCAIGISDGETDFDDVFEQMGIPAQWRRTATATASDIRSVFEVFSKSVVRASQCATSFSQTAAGGFATP